MAADTGGAAATVIGLPSCSSRSSAAAVSEGGIGALQRLLPQELAVGSDGSRVPSAGTPRFGVPSPGTQDSTDRVCLLQALRG